MGDRGQEVATRDPVGQLVDVGEDQDPILAVLEEQGLEDLPLVGRGQGDLLLGPIALPGRLALRRAERQLEESRPALGPADENPIPAAELEVCVSSFLIAEGLLVGQFDLHPDRVVGRQDGPGHLLDRREVGHGADALDDLLVAPVRTLEGRGEAHPERGEGLLGDRLVDRPAEVVTFVEDQHPEAIPDAVDLSGRGVIGDHRDGLEVVLPSTDHADGEVEAPPEHRDPLAHEIEGRDDDAGIPGDPRHGQERQEGLPRPRGQHDDPPPPLVPPRVQGLPLVGIGLEAGSQDVPLPPLEAAGLVHAVVPGEEQRCLAVGRGGSAQRMDPGVLHETQLRHHRSDRLGEVLRAA